MRLTELNINQEQKDKLIEMCENLFGFKFAIGTRTIRYYGYNVSSGFVQADELIDWFEFCLTHLQCKLKQAGAFNDDIKCDSEILSSWINSHPVDYLYEKYKKLNIKNT